MKRVFMPKSQKEIIDSEKEYMEFCTHMFQCDFSGRLIASNSKKEELTITKNSAAQFPEKRSAFYFHANPYFKRNEKLKCESVFQAVIPCTGNVHHIHAILDLFTDHETIPRPTYIIDNRDSTFDIIYSLKKTLPLKQMRKAFLAMIWSLAGEYVKETSEIISYAAMIKEREEDVYPLPDFQICTDKIKVNPKLRIPGSYNLGGLTFYGNMVRVYDYPVNKLYTYHEILNHMGLSSYRADYQIMNVKRKIKRIQEGKGLKPTYVAGLKNCLNPRDAFIQINRIYQLENLLRDGYYKDKHFNEKRFFTLYTYLLCKIYEDVYGEGFRMDATNLIRSRLSEVMDYADVRTAEMENMILTFIHKGYKSIMAVSNSMIIGTLDGLTKCGFWEQRQYIRPSEDHTFQYRDKRHKNETIAICRMTVAHVPRQKILQILGITENVLRNRIRKIKQKGITIYDYADRQFDFKDDRQVPESKNRLIRQQNFFAKLFDDVHKIPIKSNHVKWKIRMKKAGKDADKIEKANIIRFEKQKKDSSLRFFLIESFINKLDSLKMIC